MIFGLIFILITIVCSMKMSKIGAFIFVLTILPFQSLMKSFFDLLGGGSAMSSWKEIAIIIIIMKILCGKERLKGSQIVLIISVFFASVVGLYVIYAESKVDAMVSAKLYLTPFLYCLCAYQLELDEKYLKKLLNNILLASIVSFAIAHVQQYLFKYEFAFFMGIAETISGTGQIIYKQSASTILGIERMYGAFIGPNELGLYSTLIICMSFYLIITGLGHELKIYKLAIVSFLFGIVTIFQTFSRVSWALTFFSLATIFFLSGVLKKPIKTFLYSAVAVFFVGLCLIYVPQLSDVVMSSVTFGEASAKDRPREFVEGFQAVIKNPFGYGLGTVSHRSASQIFHSEIFWWVIFLETGIIGGILLLINYLILSFKLFLLSFSRFKNPFTLPAGSISIMTIFAGFGSAIIVEPIYLAYLWSMIGFGLNKTGSVQI